MDVYTRNGESWTKFKTFSLNVAADEIDPYISYRLIPPSYVAYEKLTIDQRNLTNFEEKTIYNNMIVSTENNGQCINCHSYQNYKTDNMQFHMRQGFGGTMIVVDGKPKKVDLKTDKTISAGVYPAWHPKKKLIAYSTNNTGQSFHTKNRNKVEVQDTESDIILYDVEKNEVSILLCTFRVQGHHSPRDRDDKEIQGSEIRHLQEVLQRRNKAVRTSPARIQSFRNGHECNIP